MKIIATLICFLGCLNCLFADIEEISSIDEVVPYVEEENVLLVFDIDNTLITTAQELGSPQWFNHMLSQQPYSTLSQADAKKMLAPMWHRILLKTEIKPVETNTELVVAQLQRKNIKIIGITNRDVELAYPTIQQLSSVRIDFSTKHATFADFDLVDLPHIGKYINGIFFIGLRNDLTDSFIALLNNLPYQPSKIIFVDDDLKNLEAVEQALKTSDIQFLGLRYSFLDDKAASFNPAVAAIQWQYFNKILSDKVAHILEDKESEN